MVGLLGESFGVQVVAEDAEAEDGDCQGIAAESGGREYAG